MNTVTATITQRPPDDGYTNRIQAREAVVISETLRTGLGIDIGQQLRLEPTIPDTVTTDVLFTVVDTTPSDKHQIWLTDQQRTDLERVGIPDDNRFDVESVIVKPYAPHPSISDPMEAASQYEFIEQTAREDRPTDILALAPHGGWIERDTAAQADLFGAELDAPTWMTFGYGLAFRRWHISSNDTHLASFPALARLVAGTEYTYGVSFHGTGEDYIGLGGRIDTDIKHAVADALRDRFDRIGLDVEVRILGMDHRLNGMHPENVVNRFATAGGLQIEQPRAAREPYWDVVAEAVASVFDTVQR